MQLGPAVAAAFAWGFGKSAVMGARSTSSLPAALLSDAQDAALEEFEFRILLEQGMRQFFGVPEEPARVSQALIFGALHVVGEVEQGSSLFRFLDVAASGYIYSLIYREHGFVGSFLAHFAHNVGAELGARR